MIPTRNRPDYLKATLAAVLNQRDVEFEVVVVDDGSDRDIAGSGADIHDRRVNVVRHGVQRGVAAARNSGIAVARHGWLAFTDDDDIWAPDKLAAQLAALDHLPEARWSCAGDVHVDDDLNVFGYSEPPAAADVVDLMLVENAIPSGGSGVVADADLVRLCGGFDESLSICADYDLWIRLALAAPLAAVSRPLIAYRVHNGGLSRNLDTIGSEHQIIEAKYAHERARRGVVVADGIHLWMGDRYQRSGRRRPAARAYLHASSVVGHPRAAARALEAFVWPSAMRLRDARRARYVPAAWLTEVEEWLTPIRELQSRSRSKYPSQPGA